LKKSKKAKIVIMDIDNNGIANAKNIELGKSMASNINKELSDNKNVQILKRVSSSSYDKILSREIKVAEIGKEVGEDVGQADYLLTGQLSNVTFSNTYFKVDTLDSALVNNVSQSLAFHTVDPSQAFALSAGTLVDSILAQIGAVNGALTFNGGTGEFVATDPGIIFQTDFNQRVDGTSVPTPATLALFGSALGLMGAWRRRRNVKG